LRPEAKIDRTDLLKQLEDKRIGTRLLFAGNLTRQPYMSGRTYRVAGQLTNTEVVMNRTFWIGLQPSLTPDMLAYSAGTLKALLKGK
jgi:CDP-6-deoxy-D-xylo-4-hexulose-3-dehydrase